MENMIDLETMGVGPDAAIASIGIVHFDPHAQPGFFDSELYARVELDSAIKLGGTITASTIKWWLSQDQNARQEITGDGIDITEALKLVLEFLEQRKAPVWGNGATFDNVILRSAFARSGIECPWSYRDDRCFRTFRELHRKIEIKSVGTAHNALDDARYQAIYMQTVNAAQ